MDIRDDRDMNFFFDLADRARRQIVYDRHADQLAAHLLKRKDLMPTGQSRDLGVADHCGILIVSAVEILCDYIAELKGE